MGNLRFVEENYTRDLFQIKSNCSKVIKEKLIFLITKNLS